MAKRKKLHDEKPTRPKKKLQPTTPEPQRYLTQKDEQGIDRIVVNTEWTRWNKQRQYEKSLRRSGIPEDYYDLDFDDYTGTESRESLDRAMKYAERCRWDNFQNVSLYLYGPNSTQKTMVACAIGKEFIWQGYDVQFVLAGNLISLLLRDQGYTRDEENRAYIDKLRKETDLIILDDIFDKNKSILWKNSPELVLAAWDTFLRDLSSNNVRFIMTSNFKLRSLESEYTRSIVELVDRNLISLEFRDSVMEKRRARFEGLFD
jgi:DNA replication protein DnaC